MARRITIMLDDDLNKKIRILQSKTIQKENKSASFSKIINSLLAKQISKN